LSNKDCSCGTRPTKPPNREDYRPGGIVSETRPRWDGFVVHQGNKGKGLFIYWVIRAGVFEGYPIRAPKHPTEPNFESRTYNFYGHCQRDKMREYVFKKREADNLLVWNNRKGVDRILGCYVNITHTTEVPDQKHGTRCAFLAKRTYVLKENKAIPLREFGIKVEKRPPHLSYWIYVLDATKTSQIIESIEAKVKKKEGLSSSGYLRLIERYQLKHGET